MSPSSNKEIAVLKTSILLSLLPDRPLYGCQLAHLLSESAPELLKDGEGVIYPLLRRLEHRDLLKASWKPNPRGKRRRYYSLTKKGRRKLQKFS